MPPKGESAYSQAQITEVLLSVVAWAGNVTAAHRALSAKHDRVPNPSTIYNWIREVYATEFDELRTKHAEALETNLVNELRENARKALDVERLALDKALHRLEAGEDKDPSRTAANAATVADKNTGKMLALQGRPTSIREDRNLEEVLRKLVQMKVITLPDEPQAIEAASDGA